MNIELRPPRRFAPPRAYCIERIDTQLLTRNIVESWRWWGLWITARVICVEPFGPWGRA